MIHKLFSLSLQNYVSMEYKSRIADKLLRDKLEAMGAVLIEGQRLVARQLRLNNKLKASSIWMTR